MKQFAVLFSILMLAAGVAFAEDCAGGVCPLPSAGKAPDKVTTAELAGLIKAGSVIVIDARPGVTTGLPGAKLLAGQPTAQEAAKVIPSKNSPVVTYCGSTSCFLSENLAKHLKTLGYTNVREYPQGYAGWKQTGNPVVPIH